MTMRTNCILLLVILLGAFPLNRVHADESGSIILYTPYTKISVTPGASIDYSIDLINNTDRVTNANLSVSGLPGSWKHEIKSGGWTLSQLSVLSKEKKTFNLKVEVPLKVNKGSYHFTVFAGETKLPLEVVVAQKGTYQTEFTTDQPNMQGNSKSTFTFNATLKNQTADQQLYALMANAPRGWSVVFKPNYKQATSAQVEANSSQNVSIEIVPPANVEAGNYKIPVRAATGTTSADLELEVVVTGSYEMELSTPRGLLSTEITAGDVKHAIEAFVEQLRLSLTQGDKVKIDGLGTFHITLSSEGAEKEKDCTVRNIRRVNVRFVADKALQLVNTSHATTRGENNVDFILAGKGDGEDADGGNSGSGGSGEAPDPAA